MVCSVIQFAMFHVIFNIIPHKNVFAYIGYGSCSVRHESVLFASGVFIGVVFTVFAVSMFAKFMSLRIHTSQLHA